MSVESMVVRVARVIAASEGFGLDGLKTHTGLGESVARAKYAEFIGKARAVIKAMREPTEAMVEAGAWEDSYHTARVIWPEMIDAALEEEPK